MTNISGNKFLRQIDKHHYFVHSYIRIKLQSKQFKHSLTLHSLSVYSSVCSLQNGLMISDMHQHEMVHFTLKSHWYISYSSQSYNDQITDLFSLVKFILDDYLYFLFTSFVSLFTIVYIHIVYSDTWKNWILFLYC